MKARVIACCLAALVAGCASSGRPINAQHLQELKVGEATVEQTITLMGPPTMDTSSSDGSRRLTYIFTAASVKAATFVPIVGIFAGGTEVRSDSVTLVFDQAGKLKDVTKTLTATETSNGVAPTTAR